MTDRCEIPGCGNHEAITYLGHGVCAEHYDALTKDELERALGIGRRPTIAPTSTATILMAPEAVAQPSGATENTTMSKPKTEKKTPEAKPEKAAKKREPKPKEENLVVFAFRLTPEERDAIHKAAGPARASRFVRAVAIAAANEDEAAIREILNENRAAQE